MKRAATWLGVMVGIVLLGRVAITKAFAYAELHTARTRVETMLKNMKPGGNISTATCLWREGSLAITNTRAFTEAHEAFLAWTREKGIETISDYEILDAWLAEASEVYGASTVVVVARIDGRTREMRMSEGNPIEWVPWTEQTGR